MLHLIWKDLMIQKKDKTMLITVILSFVSAAVLPANPGLAGVILLMAVYLMVIYATAYDYKYQAEIMMNSLPVSRKQVVLAKYLAPLAFAGVMLIIILTVGGIIQLTGWRQEAGLSLSSSIGFLMVSLFMLCVYLAVYFPLYFKLGYQRARWVNFITLFTLYGLLWFLGQLAQSSGETGITNQNGLSEAMINLAIGQGGILPYGMLLGLGIILLNISARISISIYQHKEF